MFTMPSIRETSVGAQSPGFSLNPVLERAQSQWLFTQSDLQRSPSVLEGLSVAQELANRQKGVNFITQVGILLKLPQLTLATASVYLHRFFMRHNMALPNKPGLHHYSVAATALFLATKVEENCRKMKELVVACCRVAQKQPNLVVDEQSKEYWKWRDTILHNEDLLLEALCFDLQLEQPYRILFDFLCYFGVQDNKSLRNASWAFLNDSHVTTMCLLFSARTIAGSALYVGVKLANLTLPDDEQGRPWWEHLELDILEIQRACNQMADVYENPALPRQGQKDAYTRDDDLMIFDQTRHTFSPRPDRSPSHSARSGSLKRDREDTDEQQSEWGASTNDSRVNQVSGNHLSPKRPRRDQDDEDYPSRQPSATRRNVDDVQQRIDDIVNASNNSHSSTRIPTSSRIPPSQNQWSQSSNNNSSAPGGGYASSDRRPSYDRTRRPQDLENKVDNRDNDKAPPARFNGVEEIDDAEKVDYGSEEGEL